MATKTRTRKSKPETNGTPVLEEPPVSSVLGSEASGKEKLRYEAHWQDQYWEYRVEAHETLVPFRKRLIDLLVTLEEEGLIRIVDLDVDQPDDDAEIWDADKMRFTFTVTDGKKRAMPNVSITLAAEGSQ
jgi:hypothetical protein